MKESIKKFLSFSIVIGILLFLPIIIILLFLGFLVYGTTIAAKRAIETTLELVFKTIENLRMKIEGE